MSLERKGTISPMYLQSWFNLGWNFKYGGILVSKGQVGTAFGLNPLPSRPSAFVPIKKSHGLKNPLNLNIPSQIVPNQLNLAKEKSLEVVSPLWSEVQDQNSSPQTEPSEEVSSKRAVEGPIIQEPQDQKSDKETKNEENTDIRSQNKESVKFDKGIRFSKQNDKGKSYLHSSPKNRCSRIGCSWFQEFTKFFRDYHPKEFRELIRVSNAL